MRHTLMAAAGIAAMTCGWADVAKAYEFQLTYQYGGNVFNFRGAAGYQGEVVDRSGVISTMSDQADPGDLVFSNQDLVVSFVNSTSLDPRDSHEFLVTATFSALGGQGRLDAEVAASNPIGTFAFGGEGYGGDSNGLYFSGPISGSFSIAQVSPVPLPAGAPLFGVALLTLGVLGCRRGHVKAIAA